MPWPVTSRKPASRSAASISAATRTASTDEGEAPVANGWRSIVGMTVTTLLLAAGVEAGSSPVSPLRQYTLATPARAGPGRPHQPDDDRQHRQQETCGE